MRLRNTIGIIGLASVVGLTAIHAGPAHASSAPAPQAASAPAQDDSPEARMNRRFPQKVRVGDLIGLPVLDDDDVTLGYVKEVVRTPEGKIKLIVSYSPWFGWFGRPVAVPIEVVAILGRQIASLDMPPKEYEAAPTWSAGKDKPIPDNDTIRIALTRR
ncbi:MAG: PRC-barrel domain-containing protein [Rhodoplanes sp.]